MKFLIVMVCILAAIFLIVWLGLQVKPKSFAPFAREALEPQTIPLPADLPAPVERFYRTRYGDAIPVINTAVISGRGTLKLAAYPCPYVFDLSTKPGKTSAVTSI